MVSKDFFTINLIGDNKANLIRAQRDVFGLGSDINPGSASVKGIQRIRSCFRIHTSIFSEESITFQIH